MMNRTYIAIDLKSFYASVECVERGLDPLTTNLVVADVSKTEKTICLAVTPSLKAHGLSGRARLFEVIQQVSLVNAERKARIRGKQLTGKFSKKYNLPHINAHAFRHTMASMLYFNGVDSVSISKRLGHAQVSTTANIYAHIIEEADQRNADILSDIFLKKA